MISLILRNLFFTILQPEIVVGLLPFWILGSKFDVIFDQHFSFLHFTSAILFLIGLLILIICIINFAVLGRGTLSPVDPTKKLVITGFYKFSRNPMYLGVMMMLIGEAVLFQSISLWVYIMFVFSIFNVFIIYFEEPRLRKDFEEDYYNYCLKIRRWI